MLLLLANSESTLTFPLTKTNAVVYLAGVIAQAQQALLAAVELDREPEDSGLSCP